jgi:hypothetical protein
MNKCLYLVYIFPRHIKKIYKFALHKVKKQQQFQPPLMSKKIVSIAALIIFALSFLTSCKSHQRCAAYSDARSNQSTNSQATSKG